MLVPLALALRRMRARPVVVASTVVALAAAGLLIGWSGVRAGLALEDDVPRQIARAPVDQRSLVALYNVPALEADGRAEDVRSAFARVKDVTAAPRRVQIWQPKRVTASGLRLAAVDRPERDVTVLAGRLPAGCRAGVCEVLALRGPFTVGARVPLADGVTARVVGRGRLDPEVLPDTSHLEQPLVAGTQLLLVRRAEGPLAALLAERGRSVLTTASLAPAAVDASQLRAIERRLRNESVRLQRGRLTVAAAPSALLGRLADRGEVARRRLLIVAGQGAALVLAFTAFAASVRRRETERLEEQLLDFGGSRVQLFAIRGIEALLPCLLGGALAVAVLLGLIARVSARDGLPASFTAFALPTETLVAIAGVTLSGAALLVVASAIRTQHRPRRRLGTLEVAAAAALAATAVGGAQPGRGCRGDELPRRRAWQRAVLAQLPGDAGPARARRGAVRGGRRLAHHRRRVATGRRNTGAAR